MSAVQGIRGRRPGSGRTRMRSGILGYPTAMMTLAIGIAVTFSLFFQAQFMEQKAAETQLRRDTADIRHALRTGIENKLNSLSALRSLFAASREVDLNEFRIFSEHLLRRFKEIEAFEWIPRIMREDLPVFEAQVERDLGMEDFFIFRRGPDGLRLEPETRDEYYPVFYAEPFEQNFSAVGHDQASSHERFAAMQRARDADDIVSTRIIRIHRREDQGGSFFKGFIAYLPVFKSDSTAHHAPRPPQILTGYVATVFRAEELTRLLLGRTVPPGISVRVSASGGEESSEETLLDLRRSGDFDLEHTENFDIAGCRWVVRCAKKMDPFGSSRRASSMVLIVGILVSALLSALLVSMERKKMHQITSELSMRDELTGLYNRRGFVLLAEEQLRLSKRSKSGFWVVSMDLDGLKRVNDTRGHAEGDRMIRRAAGIIKASLRDSDILARFGGDEFTALVIEAGPQSGQVIVDHIRSNARSEAVANRERDPVLLSIGTVYVSPMSQSTLESWLEQADKTLYQDKHRRKKSGDRS